MDYSSLNEILNNLEINNLEINTQPISPNPLANPSHSSSPNPNPSSSPSPNPLTNPSSNPSSNSSPDVNSSSSPNENPSYVDNKKAMTNSLQRDININKKQPNFELANPQRQQNLDTEYQKFDQSNNMINNYNFAYSQRTINPDQFIDFTKMNTHEEKDKTDINNINNINNINDRLNNRGFTPGTSRKFFN